MICEITSAVSSVKGSVTSTSNGAAPLAFHPSSISVPASITILA